MKMWRMRTAEVITMSNFALPEISIVGGDHTYLDFEIFEPEGDAVDVSTMSASFAVIDYTNKFGSPQFTLQATVIEGEQGVPLFRVTLQSALTVNMFGKFIYQLSVRDYKGYMQHRQGIVLIHKNIDTNTVN